MSHRTHEDHQKNEGLPSSPGTHSPSVTPKDVSKQDAASKDVTERHLSPKEEEHEEELLDDAVDLTFPASDPIAITPPKPSGERHKHH
jgi:hypothetical protein